MTEDLALFKNFIVISSTLFLIAMGFLGIAGGGEKRERFFAMSPMSTKSIGMQNLLFVIICKASIFLLWIIAFFTTFIRKYPGLIWVMTSITMCNLTIVGIVMIGIDLGYYGTRFRKTIFIIFLVGAMYLYSIFWDIMFAELINDKAIILSPDFIKTPLWVLSTVILAGLILFLDYILFINRKYFLN